MGKVWAPRAPKPGQKRGRPKGGVFLHKKGGKKGKARKEAPAKAQAPVEAAVGLGGTSGDADDFGHMLDTMADYRPPADDLDAEEGGSGDGGGSGSEGEGGKRQRGGEGVGADGGEGGGKAKRRRKGGQKLSALEFEASRQLAREIAECSAEEQAAWLWQSCQRQCAASALERGGLTEAGVAALPAQGPLEERLKALEPASWQADFCGGGGGRGQPQRGQQQQGQGGHEGQGERPPGSPSLLLVSASAIGAVGLIKLCPQFHKACRIGALFAKHKKVHEQEELLRTQVTCVAAGTPNRLCKLADSGALRLDRLKHVVLDVALDAKQRDILAIPETCADWWQFYQRHLAARHAAGGLKLSLVNSDALQPQGGS